MQIAIFALLPLSVSHSASATSRGTSDKQMYVTYENQSSMLKYEQCDGCDAMYYE